MYSEFYFRNDSSDLGAMNVVSHKLFFVEIDMLVFIGPYYPFYYFYELKKSEGNLATHGPYESFRTLFFSDLV